MVKRLIAVGLVALVVVVGVVAYGFLKPTEGASEPIEAIPIELEPVAEATTAQPAAQPSPTTPAAATEATEATPEPAAETAASPTVAATEAVPATEAPAAAAPTIFEISQDESEARYIIDEDLRGTPTTVVGATNQVAGQLAVNPSDPSVTQVGTIQINARTFATLEERRDNAVRNRILSTDQFEYVTFTPTELVGLPQSAGVGDSYTFQIVGDLTIRDQTLPATWDVTVTAASDTRLEGTATSTIRYADWGLAIPQVPFVANVGETVQLELDFVALAVQGG